MADWRSRIQPGNSSREAFASAKGAMSVRWRVAHLVWEARPALAVAVVGFVLIEGILPPLALVAIGWATGHIPAAVRDGLGSPAGHALLGSLGVGAAAYGLSLLRGPVEDLLSAYCSAVMSTDLQRRLTAAVSIPIGIEHLERPEVLDQLSAATGELSSTRPSDAPMTLAGALGDRLQGLLACMVLATFRWWIGLMFFVGWAAMRPPLRRLLANRALLTRQATSKLRHSWYYLGATIRPEFAKEVRLFGLSRWLLDRYHEHWRAGMDPALGQARKFERIATGFGVLICLMYVIGAGTLGLAAYHGSVPLQTVSVMLPMFMMAMQVGGVSTGDVTLEQMLAAVPDVDSLVGELAGEDNNPGSGPVSAAARDGRDATIHAWSTIRFEHVSYAYPGQSRAAIDDLDLSLSAGSSLAIVGVNGAGKTTLVTLLARLRDPTSGRIAIDDVDLSTLDALEWQRRVAVVYQEFTHYPFSARDNVALVDLGGGIDEQLLERAVEMAGATEVIARLPHRWDTVLATGYRRGVDLSGGQWQRIALARALYSVGRGAQLLILDEPTSQLDIRAEAAFYERFLELTTNVTTIVVSHRFSTVRRAERIAVLDGGRITELGSHDELLDLDGNYAAMFRAQAAGFLEGQHSSD
jgi:ATP-binding cassette, subfamily B, bacterial